MAERSGLCLKSCFYQGFSDIVAKRGRLLAGEACGEGRSLYNAIDPHAGNHDIIQICQDYWLKCSGQVAREAEDYS